MYFPRPVRSPLRSLNARTNTCSFFSALFSSYLNAFQSTDVMLTWKTIAAFLSVNLLLHATRLFVLQTCLPRQFAALQWLLSDFFPNDQMKNLVTTQFHLKLLNDQNVFFCDTFAYHLCSFHVFLAIFKDRVFTSLFFQLEVAYILNFKLYFAWPLHPTIKIDHPEAKKDSFRFWGYATTMNVLLDDK